MINKKLKIGLICLVVICVVLAGTWWILLNSQKSNNQQEEMGTANLGYTIYGCKAEPKKEIVEAYNNKIAFDIDFVATNCSDNKLEMERDGNLIKLLLHQGGNCSWSVACYNIKGEIAPLKNDRYILELRKAGSETFETFRKEVYLK
jgi:hypothetical protein